VGLRETGHNAGDLKPANVRRAVIDRSKVLGHLLNEARGEVVSSANSVHGEKHVADGRLSV
jgi:hypothetical protein